MVRPAQEIKRSYQDGYFQKPTTEQLYTTMYNVQDHHSGVTLVGLVSQVVSRLISTDRARHPMSVVASSIVACVIGLRNQSNPLNTVQSET